MSFIKYCESPQDLSIQELFTLNVLKKKFEEEKCEQLVRKLSARKVLWLNGLEIENVDFLEYFSHFERLDLSDNHIKDIDSLLNLQQLTHLWLAENEIQSIKVLARLNTLELLVLSENCIKSIDALAESHKLKALNISGNWIADLSPLKRHQDLKFIFLGNNMIEDLSPLAFGQDVDKLNNWYRLSTAKKQEDIIWKNLLMEKLLPHEDFRVFEIGNNPLGRPAWHGGVVRNPLNCPPDASFQVVRHLCRF